MTNWSSPSHQKLSRDPLELEFRASLPSAWTNYCKTLSTIHLSSQFFWNNPPNLFFSKSIKETKRWLHSQNTIQLFASWTWVIRRWRTRCAAISILVVELTIPIHSRSWKRGNWMRLIWDFALCWPCSGWFFSIKIRSENVDLRRGIVEELVELNPFKILGQYLAWRWSYRLTKCTKFATDFAIVPGWIKKTVTILYPHAILVNTIDCESFRAIGSFFLLKIWIFVPNWVRDDEDAPVHVGTVWWWSDHFK